MEYYSNDRFSIRDITDIAEMKYLEEMQAVVWGMEDCSEVVPKDLLKIVQANGGILIGAYDQQNKILGFVFGFLGFTASGKLKHCSHMMGILPGHRSTGIGMRLKMVQREMVLAQGIDLMTWTVNPLEGVNASINFGKLGVICQNYLPNFYGEMDDELNHGMPSNRFEVEWWLDSKRVKKFMDRAEIGERVEIDHSGALLFDEISTEGVLRYTTSLGRIKDIKGAILFEVPSDLQAIRKNSMELALAILEQTDGFFKEATNQGFIIADFITKNVDGVRKNYYVLERGLKNIIDRS